MSIAARRTFFSGTLLRMKIALVHELLTMRGGAEKVLRVFADMFPEAPIYTLLYDEVKLGDWFPASRVRTSTAQKRTDLLGFNHHLHLSAFAKAAEAWDFSEYDVVLSSSSAFAHGIITNGAPKHVCYVHSPARYLWDRTHDVLDRADRGPLGFLRRRYLEKLFHRLRIWDSEAADRPDRLIAASKTVQRRIELYWRHGSDVVHPPIDDIWLENPTLDTRQPIQNDPYLVVSTLVPYKRIDLAIAACNDLQRPLVIAGEGPDRKRLERMAGPTVRFVGYRNERELKELYLSARATLFPGDEDFGLVPLESLACGTPVIAYRAGGALETLADDTTEFFTEPTGASLAVAIRRFESRTFDPNTLIAAARPFSRSNFEQEIRRVIDETVRGA
jgi:glycosyltransferase involved in cell wall biosynthesis